MERKASPQHTRRVSWLLLTLNAIDILLVTLLCVYQSHGDYSRRKTEAEDSFVSMVESFCLFASDDMKNQQNEVFNWSRYIENNGMDMDAALTYLSSVSNTQGAHIHLLQTETLHGFCTDLQIPDEEALGATSGGHPMPIRPSFREIDYRPVASAFSLVLPSMVLPLNELDGVYLSSPFIAPSLGIECQCFCSPVTIAGADENTSWIIMKVVTPKQLASNWKVADSYKKANVSLIDKYGGYILKGTGFEGDNFWDFIRDAEKLSYFDIGKMQGEFNKPGISLMELKDASGKEFYYSGYATREIGSQNFIVSIRKDEILAGTVSYSLALTVLIGMLGIMILDGNYLMSINKKLKESAERAERESHFKTDFLSSMSHDIRTPLNAMMGLTKIMQQNEDNPSKQRECLNKIEISGRHLLMLINDVLDISKIESEGVVLSPAPFSVSSVIDEIRTLTEAQSRDRGLTVTFNMKNMSHDMLIADELRVKQVFMNLLSNAIKYTPKGGSVAIEVSEDESSSTLSKQGMAVQVLSNSKGIQNPDDSVELSRTFRADYCLLRYVVRDTGIGMSDKFMKTMYQAFTREVDTRVNKISGTGLGLAIVKQLVDLMGGKIDCQSEVGKGTTFTVELDFPIAHDENSSRSGEEDTHDEFLKGLRILIAEDNDINWEIENELLSYRGIVSDRAVNGKVCVDMLLAAPAGTYAAILMDMQMPEMDGIAATKAIRALYDPQRKNIPIVAVTANAFLDDVRACMAAGMNAHVCKPVNVDSVAKALRSALKMNK
ncbi:MAG: response regulator [Treponema sp.]|nr:response regulator [Treponema sp.]